MTDFPPLNPNEVRYIYRSNLSYLKNVMRVTQPKFDERSYMWEIMKLWEKQENGLFPGMLKFIRNATSNKSHLI